MVFVDWFSKITNNALLQRAGLDAVVGVGGHKNGWNRMASVQEMSVQFNASHHRHVDVRNQAGSFLKTRGCEEIGC
jgi:hypothetical protein